MRRERVLIVFAVCFMLFVASSWAFAQTKAPEQPQASENQEWKVYLESEAKKYYFNPASEEKVDQAKIRVWEKITSKGRDGESDIVKSLIEFNCASSEYRIVASRDVPTMNPGNTSTLNQSSECSMTMSAISTVQRYRS